VDVGEIEPHVVVDGDILGYMRRLGSENNPWLAFPTTNVELHIPEQDVEEVRMAISALEDGNLWMFDVEFAHNELGVLAFLRRGDEGGVVAVLLRKQVLGHLFDQVLPAARSIIEQGRVVMFDRRQDVRVLDGEGIVLGENALDLREALVAVFPVVFAHMESDGTFTTQLGLAHFVEMAAGKKLRKARRVSEWTSEGIQRSPPHIDYALCDVFAILLVYEYLIDHRH
jgi:hypothetical protein